MSRAPSLGVSLSISSRPLPEAGVLCISMSVRVRSQQISWIASCGRYDYDFGGYRRTLVSRAGTFKSIPKQTLGVIITEPSVHRVQVSDRHAGTGISSWANYKHLCTYLTAHVQTGLCAFLVLQQSEAVSACASSHWPCPASRQLGPNIATRIVVRVETKGPEGHSACGMSPIPGVHAVSR